MGHLWCTTWLGKRDSNPRSWDQNPVPYRLAIPHRHSDYTLSGFESWIRVILRLRKMQASRKAAKQGKLEQPLAVLTPDPGTRTQCLTAWPFPIATSPHQHLPLLLYLIVPVLAIMSYTMLMVHPIGRKELWHAQLVFLLAVILQFTIPSHLRWGDKYTIAIIELILIGGIGITAPKRHISFKSFNRTVAVLLIGVVSFANLSSLGLVINGLLNGSPVPGKQLVVAAFAIFITNIIVFSLWYWEIDSPGLSGLHSYSRNKKFQFPQNSDRSDDSWRPTYFDYLYVSITNSTAFSPTDTMPLTHFAKSIMSTQALISLLTVVLVTARAVNILG
jgi:hypothetical protein